MAITKLKEFSDAILDVCKSYYADIDTLTADLAVANAAHAQLVIDYEQMLAYFMESDATLDQLREAVPEGEGFFCIAINDDSDDAFGYPMMFHPKKELHTNEEILKFLLTTEDKLNGVAGILLTQILAALDDIKTNGDENKQSLLYRITRILDPSV